MKLDNLEKIVFKSLKFLPCFFTIANYFTALTAKQRSQPIGWFFLIFSIGYFIVAFILLIINWKV